MFEAWDAFGDFPELMVSTSPSPPATWAALTARFPYPRVTSAFCSAGLAEVELRLLAGTAAIEGVVPVLGFFDGDERASAAGVSEELAVLFASSCQKPEAQPLSPAHESSPPPAIRHRPCMCSADSDRPSPDAARVSRRRTLSSPPPLLMGQGIEARTLACSRSPADRSLALIASPVAGRALFHQLPGTRSHEWNARSGMT